MDIIEKLESIRIVPVIVTERLETGLQVCEQLCRCGLNAAEITFRTAAAAEVISEVSKKFPELFVGAGTVLNVRDLHRAIDAGAKFAVAPGFNPAVVREAVACGFTFIPGVCTPSECEQAMELGCKLLKFFPAETSGGVSMLKALAAPYRHLGVKFMPTGGIKPANAEDYLRIPEVTCIGGTWLNQTDDAAVKAAVALAAKYRN